MFSPFFISVVEFKLASDIVENIQAFKDYNGDLIVKGLLEQGTKCHEWLFPLHKNTHLSLFQNVFFSVHSYF